MISRRKFLGAVSAGAVIASRPSEALSITQSASDGSLPPSLAQLKSRKDEAQPITREERQQRQERARQLMNDNALDAILLMEGTSMLFHRDPLVGRRALLHLGASS